MFTVMQKSLNVTSLKKTGIAAIKAFNSPNLNSSVYKKLNEAENYFIIHFDKEEKFQGGVINRCSALW